MKNKYLYLLFPLLFVPLITYFFIWENANIQKEQEIQKNLEITKATAIGIGRSLDEIMERNAHIANNVSNINPSQYLYHSYESMYIVNTHGKVIAHSSSATSPDAIFVPVDRFLNQALEGKTIISDLVKSPFSKHFVIAVYTPIKQNNKTTRILVNELPPGYFKNALASLQLGTSGKLALLDSEGYFIYSGKLNSSENRSFSTCYRDNPGKQISVVERISRLTGEKTVFTKVRLHNTGWYVVAFQKSSELGAVGNFILLRTLIFLLVLSFFLLILHLYHHSKTRHERLLEEQKTEKLALIGELAAGMAHEIRNPLTTIKGFTELLNDSYYNDNRRELLNLIEESVTHIDEIVTETLLLAKPQKMHITDVNMNELIQQVHDFISTEALMQEIDFSSKLAVEPVIVQGDATHLKQLLLKLIRNSFEATPAKGNVSIRLEVSINVLHIIIKDTGTGMEEEVLKKLGTPFFTTKPEGTGLDVSVCERIVYEHKGRLYFESKPGLGTTAIVELPCQVLAQAENPLGENGFLSSNQLCMSDVDFPAQGTSKN